MLLLAIIVHSTIIISQQRFTMFVRNEGLEFYIVHSFNDK